MPDRYRNRRAALVSKWWRWEWHFRDDGTMWIRCPNTGRAIDVGRVE